MSQVSSRAAGHAAIGGPFGVLMVTGAYFPELSGAGLQCRALVRQLSGRVSFSVLTTATDPRLPLEDERDGVKVHRVLVDPSSAASKAAAALRTTRILWRERSAFDIVHLHGFSQKSIVIVLVSLLLGKRVAIKMTSVGHDDPPSLRRRGALAYWCYARARRFFGVSPRLEALYAESGLPRDRFTLIPNGVDLERFRPSSDEERRVLRVSLGLAADATVVLFVGFFSKEKCPDLLFDAWSDAAARHPHTVLVFVGATQSRYYEVDAELARGIRERAARTDLSSRVHFVETALDIEQYHRAADVFVLPSVREGLPNALLEAMACGTACVATRLEGVTDTLIDDGRSGMLVPPRDRGALAAALDALLADRERRLVLGSTARARVERDFSLARTADRYYAAYRELQAS